MKKFISLIIVVLIITTLTSIASAKTFSDVTGTKYADSVDLLTNLGIVDGYTDGKYKPNNKVTRAEMAKLIIVALGKDSTAASLKGKTNFSDVKEDSWATGYINCAVSIEIIKGYTDGTFKPNQTVTYVEASTMLLRALNYTKELESETYPTGYMRKANSAGILDNVTANSSSDGAIRGNVAIMLVNTLKGGVRKIVATTSKGGVEYGDGLPLIESSFPDYKFVKEGEVVDIDFTDDEIYVRDKSNSRRVTLAIEDEEELLGLFMRKVQFLYDSKNKKNYFFNVVDDYKLVTVDVDEIDDETIFSTDDEEYELPDSDEVLLAYISNYDEVDTAYLVMNKKEVISAVLVGTPKIYVGVITDYGFQVDKRNGFEILTPEGKYEEYALSNTSEKIKDGAVILFSLNNSDYAIMHDKVYVDDSVGISELSSDSITLKKQKKVTFTKDTEYYVYSVGKDKIEEIKLKDIEQEFDTAYIAKFSDVYYLLIFEDCVDDEDIVSNLSVAEARDKLKATIKKANTYLKKESSYSVETYEELDEAVDDGNLVLDNSSSAAKLELAERKISSAISGLKSASSSDKQLRSDFEDLQDLIKEASSKKSSDYTATSFANLTAEIKVAKAVKLSSTTSSKIAERIDALEKAINLLVTNAANNEIQSALKTLNNFISKAETAVKNKSNYTETTINKVNSALTNAKKLDQNKASLSEIKAQSSNLEAALDGLEAQGLAGYKTARKNLDTTYKEAVGVDKSDYTKESYEMYLEKLDPLKTEYADLKSTSEVAELSTSAIKTETTKVTTLQTKLKNAMKTLVTVTDSAYRASLSEYIAKGRGYTEATWKNTSIISYKELVARLDAADKVVKDMSKSEADVQAMLLELIRYGI